MHLFSLCSWFHNWDTITEPQEPILPVVSVCKKVSEATFLRMQQLKIIIARAHNNPLREAFWGALRAQQVTQRQKKIERFVAKKKANLKGKQQRKHLFFLCACTLSLGF